LQAKTRADLVADLPIAPISGNWTFSTAHFISGSNANVTHAFVALDPAFRQHGEGLAYLGNPIFANADTPADGVTRNANCEVNPWTWNVYCNYKDLTLNTTQLSDGYHKLFIRTDSLVGPEDPLLVAYNQQNPNGAIGAGTFSAVTLVALRVDNGKTIEMAAPDEYSDVIDTDMAKNPTPPQGVVFFDGSNGVLPSPSQVLTAPVPTCEGEEAMNLRLSGCALVYPGNTVEKREGLGTRTHSCMRTFMPQSGHNVQSCHNHATMSNHATIMPQCPIMPQSCHNVQSCHSHATIMPQLCHNNVLLHSPEWPPTNAAGQSCIPQCCSGL
jgi:hypothetical protein